GQYSARCAAGQVRREPVPVLHPAAELLDQLARGDTGWCDFRAWITDPPGDRIAPQPFAAVPSLRSPPICATLQDVAHPVQRLHVVDERRATEQPDLEWIGRLVSRQAPLAFQAFEQRGFLAANIGARAAPQMY